MRPKILIVLLILAGCSIPSAAMAEEEDRTPVGFYIMWRPLTVRSTGHYKSRAEAYAGAKRLVPALKRTYDVVRVRRASPIEEITNDGIRYRVVLDCGGKPSFSKKLYPWTPAAKAEAKAIIARWKQWGFWAGHVKIY